jgi:hypothetical protein
VGHALRAAGPVDDAWQPAPVAADLLDLYGLQVVETRSAASEDEAVSAAADRYPVAVKARDPRILDKSEHGGVVLAVADQHEARAAFRYLTGGVDGDRTGVLVQPMLGAAVELVVAVTRDPRLGCAVSVGLDDERGRHPGGRALCLLPVTAADAHQAWRSLEAAIGLRRQGDPGAIDPGPVVDLLIRVGRLAQDVPQVAELYLDPVLLGPAGLVAVDVKLRLRRSLT